MRRDLWERLGGLDERFFVYFEEVDFCLRARQAGFRTVYLATARAFHRGAGTSEQIRARRLFYALRSRLQFAAKHFSAPDLAVTAAATLGLEPVTRTIGALLRGSPAAALETLQAYGMTFRAVPRLAARLGGEER